jgi:hypothetical protein
MAGEVKSSQGMVDVFRSDATAYCDLIDGTGNGKSPKFYERLLVCLSRLAKSAAELPWDYSNEEKFDNCGIGNRKPPNFYKRLLVCLSRLAKSAAELPWDYSNKDKYDDRITHDEWGQMMERINHDLGEEIGRLIEADGENTESALRAFMLSDDLADIYRDLKNGLNFFNRGEEGIQKAIWEWKFNYEHHWGPHLYNALHTIHRIRFELYEK